MDTKVVRFNLICDVIELVKLQEYLDTKYYWILDCFLYSFLRFGVLRPWSAVRGHKSGPRLVSHRSRLTYVLLSRIVRYLVFSHRRGLPGPERIRDYGLASIDGRWCIYCDTKGRHRALHKRQDFLFGRLECLTGAQDRGKLYTYPLFLQ
jgi:hypothetical protein